MMNTQFNAEIKRLEREYHKMKTFIDDLSSCMQDISTHENSSHNDMTSKKKIEQLNSLFPGGLIAMKKTLSDELKSLSMSLRKLEAELKSALSNIN